MVEIISSQILDDDNNLQCGVLFLVITLFMNLGGP